MGRRANDRRAKGSKRARASAAPAKGRTRAIRAVIAIALLALGFAVGYAWWDASQPGPAAVRPSANLDLGPRLLNHLEPFIAAVDAKPRDAARHAALGLVYEANQLWPEARACFQNAVMLAPSDPLPRLHLAIVQHDAGDTLAALATARELAARFPNFVYGQHILGLTATMAGDLDTAEAAFQRVANLNPNAPEGYIGLAELRLRAQDFEGARQALTIALSNDPSHRTAHHLLGRALNALGETEAGNRELALGLNAPAQRMLDPWTAQLPRHAMGIARQNARGLALLNAGKLDEAAQVYLDALRHHPDDPDLLNNLSIVRQRQGQPAEALALLQQSLAAHPRHHQSWSNLATWFHESNDTAHAVEAMRTAVELAPTDASYRAKLASMLSALRRYQEAREHWIAATTYNPTNGVHFAMLAEVCMELDDRDQAQSALAMAQQLSPNDPEVQRARDRLASQNSNR